MRESFSVLQAYDIFACAVRIVRVRQESVRTLCCIIVYMLLLLKSVKKDDDVALPLDVRTFKMRVVVDDFVVRDPSHRFYCGGNTEDQPLSLLMPHDDQRVASTRQRFSHT